MPITFSCSCGKSVQVGDPFAGLEGQCPSCGRTMRIPGHDGNGQFTAETPRPVQVGRDLDGLFTEVEIPYFPAVTHGGVGIAPGVDFFHDAPPEIGPLYSAASTLSRGETPFPFVSRLLLGAVAFAGGATLISAPLLALMGGARNRGEQVVIGSASLVFGMIGFVLAFWWTRFWHTCSYIGNDGIALFECRGRRDRLVRSEVFRFDDAVELRTRRVRNYYNGIYTGTRYEFVWTNDEGGIVHEIKGNHSSETGTPDSDDPFHFARMAEEAWTWHLLLPMEGITLDNEFLTFNLKGGEYIALSEGIFVLAQQGNVVELRSDQIEKMTFADDVVSIWEVNAKRGGFVGDRVHQFRYQDLGNAKFFLIAAQKLLRISFS